MQPFNRGRNILHRENLDSAALERKEAATMAYQQELKAQIEANRLKKQEELLRKKREEQEEFQRIQNEQLAADAREKQKAAKPISQNENFAPNLPNPQKAPSHPVVSTPAPLSKGKDTLDHMVSQLSMTHHPVLAKPASASFHQSNFKPQLPPLLLQTPQSASRRYEPLPQNSNYGGNSEGSAMIDRQLQELKMTLQSLQSDFKKEIQEVKTRTEQAFFARKEVASLPRFSVADPNASSIEDFVNRYAKPEVKPPRPTEVLQPLMRESGLLASQSEFVFCDPSKAHQPSSKTMASAKERPVEGDEDWSGLFAKYENLDPNATAWRMETSSLTSLDNFLFQF